VVRYEENFDTGWDNWVGGVEDWKVDVAGVRIGSFALYLPTLELSDYDLEFLGRIDTRSLNWVVRAASNDTHLRCTLTVVEGSQIEFSRAVVKAGTAEATVTAAQTRAGQDAYDHDRAYERCRTRLFYKCRRKDHRFLGR